jgi:hypothetical protein
VGFTAPTYFPIKRKQWCGKRSEDVSELLERKAGYYNNAE